MVHLDGAKSLNKASLSATYRGGFVFGHFASIASKFTDSGLG